MDIKYKLNITMKNIKTDKCKSFSKTILKKDVTIENGVPLLLDNSLISSYFDNNINKYCKDSKIDKSDLSIHSYNVESKTKNINIYFDVEDLNRYSFNPSIYARTNYNENDLVLFCEQIDENTIKWYWEGNYEVSKLIDENNNIIAEINNFNNYYLETELEVNKTYTRKLLVNNNVSLPSSLTLIKGVKSSIYLSMDFNNRDESIIDNNNVYSSRLSAFESGVGDNMDCKLFKNDDVNYGKKFRIINKVYGVRSSNIIKHNTIKFNYRYKMIGTIDYPSYDGFAKVSMVATPISKDTNEVIGDSIKCSKALEYVFDENIQVADVYYNDIIPSLKTTKEVKYKFDITIQNIKGDLTIYSYEKGYVKKSFNNNKISFTEYGYGDRKLSIVSTLITKQKDYIEYYPPKEYEPLVAVVNGDFEVTESGKKDFTEYAHAFSAPESVYDKKYYCVIEEVSPEGSYVKFKFDEEVSNKEYTLKNGDRITFSSDAIFEDKEEYRDFITQIDSGEYYINDGRKHTYNYSINDITVNSDNYKRFELEVVANTNDIFILEHTKDLEVIDDKIDTKVTVVLRALSNAIAKWEVLIHNGYYYYNQEERYLYSKCAVDGENVILEDVFAKHQISTKISVEASDPIGDIETYDIKKTTKEDLWLDKNLFFWYENKIWPSPINVSGKYYDFLEEYIYETEPFKFNKKPTEIKSITWDQICEEDNIIDVYAISYNQVYGMWNDPVRLTYKGSVPKELKMSKIIKLRFVMKPSRMPNLVSDNILFSSERIWETNMDSFLSNNVYFKEEYIRPKSINTSGSYVSNIIDLGDTALATKERSVTPQISYSGDVEFYIQHSDEKLDLTDKLENSKWIKIDLNNTYRNLKRYLKFKILLKPKSKINYINLNLTRYEYDDNYSKYIPAIGNARIKAEYNPSLSTNIYEHILVKELPFDKVNHTLIPNLMDFMYQMSLNQKFIFDNILNYSISTYGELKDNFTIHYNENEITNEPVLIQSNYIRYDTDLIERNQKGAIFEIEDNILEVNPIPQQYSPIIITEEYEELSKISSNEIEPLTNVFFINDKGEFDLYNTEEFESLGFKTLYLQYQNIDEDSVKVTINGVEEKGFSVSDNVITFKDIIQRGYIVRVKYKLMKSYCVNYDYENDKAIIRFNKGNRANIEKIRIFYETNKESSIRKLENINLNPIYNASYNGYIYICDYTLEPSKISIYPSSTFLYANGKDEITILISIKDKYDNPIENAKANIICQYGSIEKLSEVSDYNGIIPCIYRSSTISCIDSIKAIASSSVKDTVEIVNRKL